MQELFLSAMDFEPWRSILPRLLLGSGSHTADHSVVMELKLGIFIFSVNRCFKLLQFRHLPTASIKLQPNLSKNGATTAFC